MKGREWKEGLGTWLTVMCLQSITDFNKSFPPLPAPSRYLANKCSIASRIDSFIEEPTNAYGEQLRDQVEGKYLVVVIFVTPNSLEHETPQ